MKRVDERILNAMRSAISAMGSQSELARRTGLTRQHISKYVNGEVHSLESDTWERLSPVLKDFLPESGLITAEKDFSCAGRIPVVDTDRALSFDPVVERFQSFAERVRSGDAPVYGTPGRMAALRTRSLEEGAGICPPGTLIFADTCSAPLNGHLCAGRKRGEQRIVLRIFRVLDHGYGLFPSRNEEKTERKVLWTDPEKNPFLWLLPVRFMLLDNRLVEEPRILD